MSTTAQRRGLNGVSSLRRKLRNMEKFVTSGIPAAIAEVSQAIVADAQQLAPKKTGDLAASIEYKMSQDGLSAIIGPSASATIITSTVKGGAFATRALDKATDTSKEKLFQFFKGYWHEFGTKGSKKHNIPPVPAHPFMRPAADMNMSWGAELVGEAVNTQLKEVQNL